jgi:hypothetical protein
MRKRRPMMPHTVIQVIATNAGEIRGDVAAVNLLQDKCTSVQINKLNNGVKRGYRLSWVHNGEAWEAETYRAKPKGGISAGKPNAEV